LTGQSLATREHNPSFIFQSGACPMSWTGQLAFQPANRLIRDRLRSISHSGRDWPVKR
jgi:hypothetical protein